MITAIVLFLVWIFINLFKLLLWLICAALFGLWWGQGQFLYMNSYPNRKGDLRKLKHNDNGFRDPMESYQLPYEDCYITTKDGVRIHCWLILQENKQLCPTVILFHGNAGNIGYRIINAYQLHSQTGSNVLLVDYRGYGNSDGEPSERGLNLDAQACLDYIRSRNDLDAKKIFVYGSSLGGAVGITLSYHNQDKICGLIVENTFTSIDDMCAVFAEKMQFKRSLKVIQWFLYFYLTSHWPSVDLIKKIRVPILFMSGLQDELIPPEHMKRLHDVASASRHRQLHTVANGTHNDTFMKGRTLFYEVFSGFISKLV
jgi:pimeloyl-ACP methyl ester carboxylesterase